MLNTSDMFAGNLAGLGGGPGAMPGVGIGALTGMMSQQEQAAGMQNNALNQQQQQVQNAIDQLKLSEAQKDVPVTQSVRDAALASNAQTLSTTQMYGQGQKDTAAQAQIADQISKLDTSQLQSHDTHLNYLQEAQQKVLAFGGPKAVRDDPAKWDAIASSL